MNLTIYASDKGDCLLLTGADGRRVLVDGGMRASFRTHVAPELASLREAGEALDLVAVSHIDQDHISGVLQLVDDLVEWRVHDFQVERGNASHPPPSAPRPPEVRGIWHNAFHDQVGKNAGPIADLLAARAAILSGAETPATLEAAAREGALATSTREALELSRRVGANQLGIPVNREFDGKLIFVRDAAAAVSVGGMDLTVIGPFEEDLDRLRKEWNAWLRAHRAALRDIARRARADEDRLGTSDLDGLFGLALAQAEALGRRSQVTVPNLASVMLLVEEGDRRILLTGDGHAADILKGLERAERLEDGRIHVDVLKVQHHGSEHNLDPDFARRVTADHYVFCGNGEHANPDLRVVRLLVESRLAPGDDSRFTFWFNSSAAHAEKPAQKAHMRKVERLLEDLAPQAGGRLRTKFLEEGPKLKIEV